MVTIYLNWHQRAIAPDGSGKADVTATSHHPNIPALIAEHGMPDSISILDETTETVGRFKRTYPIALKEMITRIGRI